MRIFGAEYSNLVDWLPASTAYWLQHQLQNMHNWFAYHLDCISYIIQSNKQWCLGMVNHTGRRHFPANKIMMAFNMVMGAFFLLRTANVQQNFNRSDDKNQRYIFITGSCFSLSVFLVFFSPLKYRAKVCKCGICCQLIGNYSMFAHPSMAFVFSFSNIDFDIKCSRIFGRTECYGICAYFIVCNMPQLNLDQMYIHIAHWCFDY